MPIPELRIAPTVYCLLDANLLAGYYAPQTFNDNAKPAAPLIQILIDSVKAGCSPHIKLLVPEICVAEAQTVLSKHANPQWKGTTKKDDPQSIHGRTYPGIVEKMRVDLHGGKFIESLPLQRYHVLHKHLIAPIDHHTHKLTIDNKQRTNEMGGTDQLICGTAVWLTRFLGQSRLLVLTADYRMYYVLKKAHSLTDSQIETWGIRKAATKDVGFTFSKTIFPECIHLPKAKPSQLARWFGSWPLPHRKHRVFQGKRQPSEDEIEQLVELYKNFGIGRDKLPYSQELTLLCNQFNHATGLDIREPDLWKCLIKRLKRPGGTMNKLS